MQREEDAWRARRPFPQRRAARLAIGPRRRRLLAATVALPLLGLPLAACAEKPASAPTLPAFLARFDDDTMQLSDAVPARPWKAVRAALSQVEVAAGVVGDSQRDYTRSGGGLSRFYSVVSQLDADLVDARAAASAEDRRWLADATENIVARAGELSEPFASADDRTAAIEVLLVFVRRMRTARAWDDPRGFDNARSDFARRWSSLCDALGKQAPEAAHTVDRFLATPGATASATVLRTVHDAVRALH